MQAAKVVSLVPNQNTRDLNEASQGRRYVDVRAAAQILGRTENAVRILKRKGLLKQCPAKDGRVMFDTLELHRFMQGL
jgi:hypothetical protein